MRLHKVVDPYNCIPEEVLNNYWESTVGVGSRWYPKHLVRQKREEQYARKEKRGKEDVWERSREMESQGKRAHVKV